MNSAPGLLARFMRRARSVTVVTGAGVSTASGIPEYRDRDGAWKHPKPVQFCDFKDREHVRRRYWARSVAGWGRVAKAEPNNAHLALASLESSGHIDTLITQNVDGLHDRAGSQTVIDLHGRLDTVRCLGCDSIGSRIDWQKRLLSANPSWRGDITSIQPDGDAQLADDDSACFQVPECDNCGGTIKPNVVFFGESVPKDRVQAAKNAVARAGALLVVGSSLTVFSGFRFARLALEFGKPIAILNQGRTRADDIAHLKLDGDCGEVLAGTLQHLNPAAQSAGPAL